MLTVFISRAPEKFGGGSNSFARNFHAYAPSHGIRMVDRIEDAEIAIVIANRGVGVEDLERAVNRGCVVIHRIDEHLGGLKDPLRIKKHKLIKALNRYAATTVYQSEFVRETAQPYLQARNFTVIHNGADPKLFHPGRRRGGDIGHVAWSVLPKKGLRRVLEEIVKHPNESFRLVGVHRKALAEGMDFRLPNAILRGERAHSRMPGEFRHMKVLCFPSENDPCPNTVIESILSGVPVCYHPSGGTPELVRDCGEPLDRFDDMLGNLEVYRARCAERSDLDFELVMKKYLTLCGQLASPGRGHRCV